MQNSEYLIPMYCINNLKFPNKSRCTNSILRLICAHLSYFGYYVEYRQFQLWSFTCAIILLTSTCNVLCEAVWLGTGMYAHVNAVALIVKVSCSAVDYQICQYLLFYTNILIVNCIAELMCGYCSSCKVVSV